MNINEQKWIDSMTDKAEKGFSYYVWENRMPVSPNDVIRVSGNHECFVTGDTIKPQDDAHWTDEFDAWVSIRGYQMIQNAQSTGELSNNREWELMFAEWYAKDESIAGLEEAWHSERMAKSADDAGCFDAIDD
tara:strand:+ start:1034 stop:1432 length:399 start_codon:yes stop_codon:yes gene_type:complete